jgi:lysozyme family protein
MTRIKKEINGHFEHCRQVRYILAECLQKKEELDERIQFLQERLEEEWSKVIRIEKTVKPRMTVRELLEKHYRKNEGHWYSGACHCEECTCDIKGFKKCGDRFGCRAKYLERRKKAAKKEPAVAAGGKKEEG